MGDTLEIIWINDKQSVWGEGIWESPPMRWVNKVDMSESAGK